MGIRKGKRSFQRATVKKVKPNGGLENVDQILSFHPKRPGAAGNAELFEIQNCCGRGMEFNVPSQLLAYKKGIPPSFLIPPAHCPCWELPTCRRGSARHSLGFLGLVCQLLL